MGRMTKIRTSCISASPYMKKMIPSQDLEGKFARMCITPSQTAVSQILLHGFRKKKVMNFSRNNATGTPRVVITGEMYSRLKKVVALLKHLETHEDDRNAQLDLQQAENCIDRFVWYRKQTKHLPRDWKYDRANASILVDEWASVYEVDMDDDNIIC